MCSMNNPSISIVMPAYNEEGIIEKSVRDYYDEIVKKFDDAEFIVVDDWSTDNTPIILKNLKKELPKLIIVKTPTNSGHGRALRLGLQTASKEYIFHTDSDYQHDPKDFWKLYPYIETSDMVLGYRKKREDPFIRKIVSFVLRNLNPLLFGVKLRDANCPFRIYRKETLDKILPWISETAFAPSIYICIVALHFGINIKEVPVMHYPRKTGKISIKGFKLFKSCLRCIREMVGLRKKLFSNK